MATAIRRTSRDTSPATFSEPSRSLRADLTPVAANDNVFYPVLHHDGKLRTFIAFSKRGNGFRGVVKAVTIKTMMDGDTVQRFDSKDSGNSSTRPVASKIFDALPVVPSAQVNSN